MNSNKLLKTILCVFTLCVFETTYSQAIKRQVGTSIWIKDGKTSIDSTVAYIITYDQLNRKSTEWKRFPGSDGKLTDTSIAKLDTANRLIYFKQGAWITSMVYDAQGNLKSRKITSKSVNQTTAYQSFLDSFGRLVMREELINGKVNSITKYDYKGDTVIENTEGLLIVKSIRNKFNQITFHESITLNNGIKIQESYSNTYDSKGNLIKYSKFENNKLVKETIHYFKNGLEAYQIEKFYDTDYSVITTFSYEYW